MIGQLIHDKLITDFSAFQFAGGVTMFANVKKFYASNSMESRDCLILPASIPENVEGGSAGNFQTTRQYTFRVIVFEHIEASASDSEGSVKYSRLLNIADKILDYLQKEPNNLRSWGDTNNLEIYKIRTPGGPIFETMQAESGYAVVMEVQFSVFLNVIPQNL